MKKTINEILDNLVGYIAKMGGSPDYAEMDEYLDIKNISEIEVDIMGAITAFINNYRGSELAKEVKKRIEEKKMGLN